MSAPEFQAPPPEFYTWGFATSPIQVLLSLEVVGTIREQIRHSEKAESDLLAYGLLTGDTPRPGITRILDFQSLPDLDPATIEAALASPSGAVVGFYRTIPIGSTSMPEEDRALASSLFRHPNSVFLLIETAQSIIGDARFCFWGERELFDWPLMLFPFDAEMLAIEERRRRQNMVRERSHNSSAGLTQVASPAVDKGAGGAPEVDHGTVPAEPPTPAVSASERLAGPRQRTGWWWLAQALTTVVVAFGLVGVFLYFRQDSKPQVTPPAAAVRPEVRTALELAVAQRGSDLVVSWNGEAPEISTASFGMLLIRSSKVSRDVPLTTDELRAGRVVYAALEDQVRFQLNVVAGEQVTRESIIFLQPRTADSRTVQPRTADSRAVLPQIAESRPNLMGTRGGNANVGEPPASPVLPPPAHPRELRQFKPVENRNPATATPQRIEEPPPVTGTVPANSGTLSVLNQPAVSLARPASPPASSPSPAPASSPAPAPQTVSSPAVDSPAKGTPQAELPLLAAEAHPPVPIRKSAPNLPTQLKGVIWAATTVEVNASVDATGNVVKAEAVPQPGLNPLLRDAAVQAARRWKFQPAQFNGHPVPANIVLQFAFAGSR